jgi:hypothetical protein
MHDQCRTNINPLYDDDDNSTSNIVNLIMLNPVLEAIILLNISQDYSEVIKSLLPFFFGLIRIIHIDFNSTLT